MKTTTIIVAAIVLLTAATANASSLTYSGSFSARIRVSGHQDLQVPGVISITTDGVDFTLDHFGVDGEYTILGDGGHPQWVMLPFIAHISYSSSSLLFPPTIDSGVTGEITLDLEAEFGGQRVIGNFVDVQPVSGTYSQTYFESLNHLFIDTTNSPSSIEVGLPVQPGGNGFLAGFFGLDGGPPVNSVFFHFAFETITLQRIPEPTTDALALAALCLAMSRRR